MYNNCVFLFNLRLFLSRLVLTNYRIYILEFYYHTRGNFSSAHTDECSKFLPKVFSNYTAVIYLNDDFIGGETYFTTKEKTIVSKTGRLLMFQHHLMHQGNEVELDTKYIFRANWKIKIN